MTKITPAPDVAADLAEVRALLAELRDISALVLGARALGYREGLAEASARKARSGFQVITGGAA